MRLADIHTQIKRGEGGMQCPLHTKSISLTSQGEQHLLLVVCSISGERFALTH